MAVLVTDTFDRANSSTVGNDSNGNAWAEVSGAWEILNNSVRQTDTATNPGELRCGTNIGSGTHWIEARLLSSAGTGSIGLLFRMDASAFTGLSFEVADGAYKLISVSAGTPNTEFTGSAHTHASGEIYAVECSGTTINFYLNGTQVATTTFSSFQTNTRVGLHFNDDSTGSASACQWDNVRAGDGSYPGPSPTIRYKSQGAGAGTETSGAALNLTCPATVDANDILIAHVIHTGTTTAPSTPADWSLLSGPNDVGTGTVTARHWCFGKLAVGNEDGASISFGTAGGTNGRAGRIYSFSGWQSGTLADVVPSASFSSVPHLTDPQGPTVATTHAGSLAVALFCQDDNNTGAAIAGMSGGTWIEPTAEYSNATWGPQGVVLYINTAIPTATEGTVSGGAQVATNDEAGTIGFEIRPASPAVFTDANAEAATGTGTALDAVAEVIWPAPILMAPMVAP